MAWTNAVLMDAVDGRSSRTEPGRALEIHRQPHRGMRVRLAADHDLCVTFPVVEVAFRVRIACGRR
ncbi:hypothetical protein ACFU53_36930 [Streptomyces sp. NPDC057474]|uniref:hypothetical protein n=1 Tax=Streptomyces sp. NPDC057474 TaxID=3346144 RepID=UPI0036904DFD